MKNKAVKRTNKSKKEKTINRKLYVLYLFDEIILALETMYKLT